MQTIIAKTVQGASEKELSAPINAENGQDNRALVDALTNSRVYREYERAFSDLTGLPIALRPVETWQMPDHAKRNENSVGTLMPEKNRSLQTAICPADPTDSSAPVRMSNRLVGYLQIGQVFHEKPTESDVVSQKEHDSAMKLLTIFAQHLSMVSNQVFIQRENSEPPVIAKARAYIQEHQAEELSLNQVAKAVNMSSYYFCKMFKKITGINFTDYVARVRIEKSKNLLLNPNLRVSEIAFEAGFQSLTHFNRVFKKIVGQSPTHYRSQLLMN